MSGIEGKIRLGVRLLLALLFLAAGTAKLVGAPMMVQEFALFAPYGAGQWFRVVTGLIEVGGALLLAWQAKTAFYGALALIGVCLGAAVAQAAVIHQDVIHAVVIAAVLGWIAWGYRPAATAAIAA